MNPIIKILLFGMLLGCATLVIGGVAKTLIGS